MNILLIAGHGNGDPGAVGNGYQEAIETRRMANAVMPLLQEYGFDVTMFDQSQNAYDVVRFGGALPLYGIDYVVEFHLNAGGGAGTEILVHGSEAGTSVEGITLDNICRLGFVNRGIKRRNDLAVMNTVVANGISHALIETCFIDNADDMGVYEQNFDAIAGAIADGIATGFGLEGESDMGEEKPQGPSDWAAESWVKAKEMGLLDGTRPRDAVTREELAAVLVRLAQK